MHGPQNVKFNLFTFTKAAKCVCDIHSSIAFYHYVFKHYCAIFRDFWHQILQLAKIYYFHNVCKYIKFRGKIQFIEWYKHILGGPASSVGVATDYGLYGPGSNPGGDEIFPPVQTGPEAHPASCKMGTGSFPGVK